MRYIDWNIKCTSDISKIIEMLSSKMTSSECIVALQEVMPASAQRLIEEFEDRFHIEYSLKYREPGEFDTNNRKLGVMLMISKDIKVIDSGLCERNVFPERTLYTIINYKGENLKLLTLHSLTGVSFKMAKSVQFRTFAEYVKEFAPDIVSFDANEPKIDHFDVSKMVFFDQGQNEAGNGAKLFFETMKNHNLRDVLTDLYDKSSYISGEPLSVSHIIGSTKAHRRYDFIFARNDLKVREVKYLYVESIVATSDHAMIIAEFE